MVEIWVRKMLSTYWGKIAGESHGVFSGIGWEGHGAD
jgi:hypothetical protein